MTAVPRPFLSPAEYLARERVAETKSEYYSLPSIGCDLALADVYRKVTFPEDAGRRR